MTERFSQLWQYCSISSSRYKGFEYFASICLEWALTTNIPPRAPRPRTELRRPLASFLHCYLNVNILFCLRVYCAVVDIAAELPNMANNEALHRCVTKFMHGTCQPRSEYADVLCLFYCFARRSIGNAEMFASGSSAEFCIKPMLSCIGDFDVMAAYHCAVAIPVEQTPPSELPSHMVAFCVRLNLSTVTSRVSFTWGVRTYWQKDTTVFMLRRG